MGGWVDGWMGGWVDGWMVVTLLEFPNEVCLQTFACARTI